MTKTYYNNIQDLLDNLALAFPEGRTAIVDWTLQDEQANSLIQEVLNNNQCTTTGGTFQ